MKAALIILAFFMTMALPSLAAMPKTLNYQGRLINFTTKTPVTSTMLVNFLIYEDATIGSSVWNEEQTVTPDANGIISVVLGNTTPITADFNKQLWLAVEAPTGVTNALWPRRQLTAAPYAYYAVTAEVAQTVMQGAAWTNPVGAVIAFAGSTAPTGWLKCDGTAVSRTTYAALFAVIGISYGAGDTITTFNLPNLKGKAPFGQDTGNVSFDALGEIGGEQWHTLITAEMPAHTHTSTYAGSYWYYGTGSSGSYTLTTGSGTKGLPVVLDGTGDSKAHNNLPPYQVLNYIIKY